VDFSVQYSGTFTPGEVVGCTIDIPVQALTGVKAWGSGVEAAELAGQRAVGCPMAGGKKLLLPGAHFRGDPLSLNSIWLKVSASGRLQPSGERTGDGSMSDGTFPSGPV
jgi:hypothetical protein